MIFGFSKKYAIGAVAAVALMAFTHGAQAAGGSVEATNFSLSTGAGVINHDSKAIVSGEATMPLAEAYGVQLDGTEAFGEGPNRGGVAGHVFFRDPSRYLLGATALWSRVGSESVTRLGPEAETYLGNLSLHVTGGWQHTTDGGDSTAYVNGHAGYYLTDNLVVGAMGTAFSNTRGAGLDAEWKPDSMPFSIFAQGGDTNKSSGYGLLGLRMDLGTNGASLKDRDRKFDPPNIVNTFITGESGGMGDHSPASPPPPI
jgi:catechol 2,3-dioxygenase-like lactoylglutathione lyase family enzyme